MKPPDPRCPSCLAWRDGRCTVRTCSLRAAPVAPVGRSAARGRRPGGAENAATGGCAPTTDTRERRLWVSGDPAPQPRFLSAAAKGEGGLRVKEWRKAIREAAQDAGWRPWPLDVGVILEVHLHLPRPAHPSRPYPVRPDVDNGWKAVADALQACARKALHGLAVVDDSQVCEGRCSKWWAG